MFYVQEIINLSPARVLGKTKVQTNLDWTRFNELIEENTYPPRNPDMAIQKITERNHVTYPHADGNRATIKRPTWMRFNER